MTFKSIRKFQTTVRPRRWGTCAGWVMWHINISVIFVFDWDKFTSKLVSPLKGNVARLWFCEGRRDQAPYGAQSVSAQWKPNRWRPRHTHLSFPGNGLVKQQVAGLRLVNAIVRLCGAAEGLEAVRGQWRGRRGRVGLVAGSAPAPVAAAAGTGRHAAALFPGSAEALCRTHKPHQCGRPVGARGWETWTWESRFRIPLSNLQQLGM